MKYLLFFVLIILFSCNSDSEQTSDGSNALDNVMNKMASGDKSTSTKMQNQTKGNSNQVVALEAVDAGTYTYVRVNQNGKEFWAAITARPIEPGKTYVYSDGMMMKDFESKQLGKTFDSVMFIQNFSEAENALASPGDFKKSDPHMHTKTRLHNQIDVEPAEGGMTIAGIFDNLGTLGGTEVTVKGQVVKISQNIMNRNWIHIQDGTKSGKHFDLTITTSEAVNFSVGDVVTFTGTLSVDKDFGAGYRYDAILENASVEKSTAL